VPRAKVVMVAAIIIAARLSVSDSSTWEIPFDLLDNGEIRLQNRVLSTD
jgi:hypothetical protein